VNIVEE